MTGGIREDLVLGSLLDLPFKGARNYLHSTDIFPALVELARDRFGMQAQIVSLTFRRPLRHCILVSFEPPATSSGTFLVRRGAEVIPGWLVDTGNAVTRRNLVDLPSLSARAICGPGFVRMLEGLAGCSPFDVLVGLLKLIAAQVNSGRWWLCQLKLDTPLTETFPIEVRILRTLGGLFLVVEIVQRGVAIGSAQFILETANS